MVAVTIYVEGGGEGKAGKTRCREGFRKFIEKAGFVGNMPTVLASGSRDSALTDFRVALKEVEPGKIPLLLVDSEAHVRSNSTPWQHLQSRDNWNRPVSAGEDQVHLMVQCMESRFLADVSTLESYFGPGFRPTAIPLRIDIERVPKSDVLKQLESASRESKKGSYHKGRHSFEILARIDPAEVTRRSPFAKRLIDTLKSHLISS